MDSKNHSKQKKIAVIGAGAAGLVAAFYALEKGNQVIVFEKNEIAGKKLRITGNGRCNFSNADLSFVHYEHYSDCEGADFPDSNTSEHDLHIISSILEKNGRDEFIAFLNKCGIPSFEKNGYFYPLSERAGELCDLLVKVLRRKGVTFRFGCNVREILRNTDETFNLFGEKYHSLILACGGKAAPSTGSDGGGFKLARSFGHSVSFTYPVLVPLYSDPALLRTVSGVRIKAKAFGIVDGEVLSSDSGEIQFTDTSVSGIPVFQLSRHLTRAIEEKRDVRIRVDVLPDLSKDRTEEYINNRKEALGPVSFEEFFEGIFPKKYYEMLLLRFEEFEKNTRNKDSESVNDFFDLEQREEAFIDFAKNFEFQISGHAGFENAQCTRGGVLLSEMKESLESRLVPNLYIIGEMLDVDGDCGGYNLQWAFSSGKTVGDEV